MPDQLQQLLFALPFAVAAGIVGGIVVRFWEPEDEWRSTIQNFAAGLLSAIIAVDLLPQVRTDGEPLLVLAGFAAGGILMIGVNAFAERLEQRRDDGLPFGLAIAAGIDTIIDGLIIGVGFAASDELGLLLVAALSIELSVLTFSVAAEFRDNGASSLVTVGITSGIAMMIAVGAISGWLIFGGMAPATIAIVLAFASAALLYLVTEELLLKAHNSARTTQTVTSFFLGFLVLMAFTLIGPG